MSDTYETEVDEGSMDGQEPSDASGGYYGDEAAPEGWSTEQDQGYATEQDQGYDLEHEQAYATEQAQGWSTDQDQTYGADQAQDWPAEGEGGYGDQDQMLAMYDAGQSAVPGGGGSTQVNVEFEEPGLQLSGNGFETLIKNIGKSTIKAMTTIGTFAIYERAGTQVYPRDMSDPDDTLAHSVDIPAGGSASVFVELEHMPGPVAPFPDGEYRIRVKVGIVTRELAFRKHMGKVVP